MKKRILSLLMAFALAVSLLPAAAAAEEPVYDVTLSTTSEISKIRNSIEKK